MQKEFAKYLGSTSCLSEGDERGDKLIFFFLQSQVEFGEGQFSPECTVQSKTRNALAWVSLSANSGLASSLKLPVLPGGKDCCGPGWIPDLAAVLGMCLLLSKAKFSQRKQRVKM